MRHLLRPLLAALCVALPSLAQESEWRGPVQYPVWSIDQEGEFVTITYGLSDSVSKTYEVALQLTNIGLGVLEEPDAVTGHIGTVSAGTPRKIIWHYRKDYPSGLRGNGWKFILNVGWGRQKLTFATREGTFTPPRFRIDRPELIEGNGNKSLDAGESAEIAFSIYNVGMGEAAGTTARLTLVPGFPGVRVDTLLQAGDIPVGASVRLRPAVIGLAGLQTGVVKILLRIQDRFENSLYIDTLALPTQALLPPKIEVTSRWIQSASNPTLRKISDDPMIIRGDTSFIALQVTNKGRGRADSLRVSVKLEGDGWNAHYASGSRVLTLRDLPPDSSDVIRFSLVADERAQAESVDLTIGISERRAAYGVTDSLRLPARQRFLSFDEHYSNLMKRRMYDSALTLCRRQMVLEPRRASLYAVMGSVYESLNDPERAVSMYVTASDRGDRSATAWLRTHATFKEVISVTYESLPLPFLDAGSIVTVGVFSLPPTEADPAGEGLYNILRTSADRNRVVLVPYRAMVSQLGRQSLTVTDSGALKKAAKDLNITYVVDVVGADKQVQSFELRITRTVDGQIVFARQFQQSATSTALQDVARLFKDSLVPVYATHRTYSPKTGRGR